jgi:S-(hydroxymethyl)glutathione synthase
MPPSLIGSGLTKGRQNLSGGKLRCHCPSNKVEVTISSNVLHNHACGCSKCWKPAGALFSIVGVVPAGDIQVIANMDNLTIVDQSAVIQRYACKKCGVHLFGRIEKEHAFKGLDFIHVELSDEKGWQEPQFAAFVSSIIEQGFDQTVWMVCAWHLNLWAWSHMMCCPPRLWMLSQHLQRTRMGGCDGGIICISKKVRGKSRTRVNIIGDPDINLRTFLKRRALFTHMEFDK